MVNQSLKLGFGYMRLPMKKTENNAELDNAEPQFDEELIKKLADEFIAAGGTYFDTALCYFFGGSEKMLKMSVVDRYPRESFTIADKLPLWYMEEKNLTMEQMFQMTLDNLGVDYIDYYLLHALSGTKVEQAETCGAWDYLARLKKEGKIKKEGFSFHGTPEQLEDILTKHPEVDFVQLQINYADWENPKVASRRCYEIAVAHQKPIMVMEPIKGGTLANLGGYQAEPITALGQKPASFALRFAGSLPAVQTVLSGMNAGTQVTENLATFTKPLDFNDAEKAALAEVQRRLNEKPLVGCTACKYCMDTCPMQLPIPRIISAYNHYQMFGTSLSNWGETKELFNGEHGANQCIGCGECEAHCPQHLPIPEIMKKITEI